MNVSLTPELEKLVKQEVESGLYNNASEVVRDALRLLKERKDAHRAKLKKLRAAVAEGKADIEAGRYTILDSDEDVEAFFAKL